MAVVKYRDSGTGDYVLIPISVGSGGSARVWFGPITSPPDPAEYDQWVVTP